MSLNKLCAPTRLALLALCALSLGAHSFASAQAPAETQPPVVQPAPAAAAPAPAPAAAPAPAPAAAPAPAPVVAPAPAQPYPQQAYPQQPYPQQAYPQQPYPQQAYPRGYPQQPYPQQYPAYSQPYPQTVYITQPAKPAAPRPRRTMMIAGVSVLLASYGVAVITGAALLDSPCCQEDVGWALLIPVAGPYIAAGAADDGRGLLVLLGTVQVIGVALTIGGAVQYALSKNEAAARNAAVHVKLRGDRDLSFDVATSPTLMGPTAKLRF